jgi:hypothetical protein
VEEALEVLESGGGRHGCLGLFLFGVWGAGGGATDKKIYPDLLHQLLFVSNRGHYLRVRCAFKLYLGSECTKVVIANLRLRACPLLKRKR